MRSRFIAAQNGYGIAMNFFSKHLQQVGAGVVLAGLAFSFSAGLASAQRWDNGPPPPPPRYERHPMRSGFAWENGHWNRVSGRWAWAPGRYIAATPGHRWISGHWRMGPQGRYWVEGHWS
jgi:hypothetical protein